MTLLLFIYTHLGENTFIQCACGCERSVCITGDRCCQCGNVVLIEHMDNSLNQTCTTCGKVYLSMRTAFEKRNTVKSLIKSFDSYTNLEELEDVRVVCFRTPFDKSLDVKYTSYKEESLAKEPSIRVTEIVSIQGLYNFFQSWAQNTIRSSKGSDGPDDVVDFLTTTVLKHKEFTGTLIMKICM